MRPRAYPVLLSLVIAALGCDRAPARVEVGAEDARAAAQPRGEAPCVPAIADKIGVPFIRVCPRDAPFGGERAPGFWISTIPLGCSAGEHGTLACPPVTSLLQPPPELADFRAPSPKLAAVVNAYTAHKVCTMRFAGRLPTRAERARARAALGLATVVVTEPGAGQPMRVRELAEWVTAVSCAHPSDLGPECKEAPYPESSISAVPWGMLARCAARPVKASAFAPIDLGGECAGSRDGGAALAFPCVIRGPAYGSPGAAPSPFSGFELSCEPPIRDAEHAQPSAVDLAAFRCVLPEWV